MNVEPDEPTEPTVPGDCGDVSHLQVWLPIRRVRTILRGFSTDESRQVKLVPLLVTAKGTRPETDVTVEESSRVLAHPASMGPELNQGNSACR
jgi:hypothetical protein